MKVAIACAGAMFAGTIMARALSLEANEIGSGFESIEHWADDYGGFDRDYRSNKHIRVIVRDISRKVPSATVDVYFLAHRLPNGERFIYGRHHQLVKFNGDLEVKGYVDAPELKGNFTNLPLLREAYGSGALIEGWIVVGTEGVRVFDAKASNQSLLDLANDKANGQSLATLIAEYEKKHGTVATAVAENNPIVKPSPASIQPAQPTSTKAPPVAVTPVPHRYLTVTQPVTVTLPYGSAVLPAGIKLEVVQQQAASVRVKYASSEPTIPIASTDLAGR